MYKVLICKNNNVQLYVRTTQQNPSNNVWSTWRPFNNAEFRARAYEFKAEFNSNDNTAQIAVYGLKIISISSYILSKHCLIK